MKKLLVLSLSLFFLLSSLSIKAETVFYCNSELATGVIKKNGSWKVTNFKPSRWTIKFNNNYSELYGLDKDRPYLCSPAYQHTPNLLACLSGYENGQSFMFNKIESRFLFNSSSIEGYVHDNSDTNVLFVGSCSKF